MSVWLTEHFNSLLSGTLALRVKCQSARNSELKMVG